MVAGSKHDKADDHPKNAINDADIHLHVLSLGYAEG
jgi:hypothetical protein